MKITFCGGPHSGKTAVLAELERRLAPGKEDRVAFVREVASEIISDGHLHPRRNPYAFQAAVLQKQLEAEKAAEAEGIQHRILDRAVPDTYVYLPMEQATQLLRDTIGEGANMASVMARYDACLFFDTYYAGRISSGNKQRIETTYEDLEAMAQRTLNVWKNHPRFLVVPSAFHTLEEKVDYVADVLNGLLREDFFR